MSEPTPKYDFDTLPQWAKDELIYTTNTINSLRQQLSEAQAELSRYEKAVEVEGVVKEDDFNGHFILELDRVLKTKPIGQRVRVLVMPMEEEDNG